MLKTYCIYLRSVVIDQLQVGVNKFNALFILIIVRYMVSTCSSKYNIIEVISGWIVSLVCSNANITKIL